MKNFFKKAESKEDFKMVAEEWGKVLSIAPNCSDIVYQMAIVYSELEDYEKAKEFSQKYYLLSNSEYAKDELEKLLIEIEEKKES